MVFILVIICPPRVRSDNFTPHTKIIGIWAYADELTDSTHLTYKQNNLRFFCGTEEDLPSDSLEYRFWLKGHDNDWVTAFKGGWYFYTDLSPGNYEFMAQSRLNEGTWGPVSIHEFSIESPWWLTWQAITLYILSGTGIIIYIYYLIRSRIRIHNQLIVERSNQRFKTDFIIHAGREFRIPLTIILSTIEKMREGMPTYRPTRTDIQHLRNSSRMLMQMVEQLVDFNKEEQDIPYTSKGDVIEMADIPINKDTTVMIIEPNRQLADVIRRDILRFMKAEFAEGNNSDIVEKVTHSRPDAVILDTELPEANAYEILSEIKKNPDTGGIPIILVSNFDDSRSLLRAIRSEADDYISKPFNCKVLTALVMKKIRTHRELNAVYPRSQTAYTARPLIERRGDKLFIDRLDKAVFENLADPEFDVNALASAMNMSRSQLYNKIKELKGLAPVEYIREIRLNKASELLREYRTSIKEIRAMVGMPDPTNFNRRFKEKFTVSPTDYRQSPI